MWAERDHAMRCLLKGPIAGVFAVAAGLSVAMSAVRADENAVAVQQDNTTVKIALGTRPLMVYRFAEVPKKPYVQELFTPAGVNVLRDSPADHKHHHALMFAVGVDGVDFWSENDACGRQESRGIAGAATSARPGGSQAQMIEQLAWLGPRSSEPLLVERRTIAACRSKDGSATLLTWQTQLQPPAGKDRAVLGGSHYFGLGLRFVVSMDKDGRHFNAENKEGETVRGTERLTAVKWSAYTASADGKPVTVALFDHPSNPRHPARMFTMTQPFAYLSATLNLWKEPLAVSAGKPLELKYGVAVWDGEADAAQVERVYQEWFEATKGVQP